MLKNPHFEIKVPFLQKIIRKARYINGTLSVQITCTSILDCTLEEVRRYAADPRNVDTTPDISLVIDGRTLTMALAPDLQDRFMELAKRCRSVLCCRVTPLQKSWVVMVVREKLKVMTLAVGERSF